MLPRRFIPYNTQQVKMVGWAGEPSDPSHCVPYDDVQFVPEAVKVV
jgi:hypothetical protein